MAILYSKLLGMFNSLINGFYQWGYWDNLYRDMRKHIHTLKKEGKSQIPSCTKKPGIVFSFDDSYRVNDWYKYGKELFGFYDVKVTFNINGFHHFEGKREHTQQEIDMLIELQSNGHEIAHHGFKHRNATEYSSEFGSCTWIEDEIKSL